MANKTLQEMIFWTQAFHQELADCFDRSAKQTQDERAQLLLDYLAEHERTLAQKVVAFGENSKSTALNTWVSDYDKQFPPSHHDKRNQPYATMTTVEIMNELHQQHSRLVARYKNLQDFVEGSGGDLLQQIIDLEEQEILRMAQSANRLEDI